MLDSTKKGNKSVTLTFYVRLHSIQVATFHSLCPFLLTNYLKPYQAIVDKRERQQVSELG